MLLFINARDMPIIADVSICIIRSDLKPGEGEIEQIEANQTSGLNNTVGEWIVFRSKRIPPGFGRNLPLFHFRILQCDHLVIIQPEFIPPHETDTIAAFFESDMMIVVCPVGLNTAVVVKPGCQPVILKRIMPCKSILLYTAG